VNPSGSSGRSQSQHPPPTPIRRTVWLIQMMGLLRALSIKDVCHHLDIVLQPVVWILYAKINFSFIAM
jgi:hypothetical protein